jgi:hypothetical protein
VATVQKQIDELQAEQTRLSKRLNVIAPNFKDRIRNAPLMDFMAPTIKIQQIILPNVVDDVNFTRVPKMDRCQTCHLAIDKKGYEKYPQPYTTHPNLELYLGGSSPHPIERVGCTVCHEGMGQSVSFRDAAHAPADEKQKEEWEEKYGWEEPHFVVREVPPPERLPAARRYAERRLCHVRARRLLRLPQNEGLRYRHPQAGSHPDQNRQQAVAGLGEELDPQSACGQADHVDAAVFLQLEQRRTERSPETGIGGPQRG